MPCLLPRSRFAVLFLVSCLFVSCRARPKVATPPAKPAVPEELIQQHVAQGDLEFSKHHLFGWRQAEIAYAKALELDEREMIREKLRLTRFLIKTREEDEDIASRGIEELLRDLCVEPLDARHRAICEIGRAYQQGFDAAYWQTRADNPPRLDVSVFQIAESPLEVYFYTLHCKTFETRGEWDAANNPYEKFKDSPLFIYLTLGPDTLKRVRDPDKLFPDFAELLVFAGDSHFQDRKYKDAGAYYRKALALVPDYTRAINGLGNLYLFVLEDYENALKTYESALARDPTNTAALFGKGAVLHYLERFQESIDVLNDMLATDLTRKGRVSSYNVQYYRGEGRYYQAYDYHLMRAQDKARELIDLAKKDLPDNAEINYLSGLLYYMEYRLKEAEKDFLAVLRQGASNCYAYYYLGLIHSDTNADEMLRFFTGSCSCLDAMRRNLERNIQAVPGLDVEPEEKAALTAKLTKRLSEFRVSGAKLIEKMSSMVVELQGRRNSKAHLDLMDKVLKDLRPAAKSP
ncbi:MAG: hypothetical protein DMG08_18750 [Acidobacteria bacterium]|nr:MAG: hypothetical protein DMG08_18750 [Acidobacteriota bacterium]